jgi:hypothetical protein
MEGRAASAPHHPCPQRHQEDEGPPHGDAEAAEQGIDQGRRHRSDPRSVSGVDARAEEGRAPQDPTRYGVDPRGHQAQMEPRHREEMRNAEPREVVAGPAGQSVPISQGESAQQPPALPQLPESSPHAPPQRVQRNRCAPIALGNAHDQGRIHEPRHGPDTRASQAPGVATPPRIPQGSRCIDANPSPQEDPGNQGRRQRLGGPHPEPGRRGPRSPVRGGDPREPESRASGPAANVHDPARDRPLLGRSRTRTVSRIEPHRESQGAGGQGEDHRRERPSPGLAEREPRAARQDAQHPGSEGAEETQVGEPDAQHLGGDQRRQQSSQRSALRGPGASG